MSAERGLATPPFLYRFPHPGNLSQIVHWNGNAFECDGTPSRVLSYDIAPSGWTDDLTGLHEQAAHEDHFIDVASRRYALAEVMRCLSRIPSIVLEIGCSSGYLLRELLARLPQHTVFGADYTRGTLEALGKQTPGVPLVQFDLTQCPLPDSSIDVVVLLNVLEHVRDHEVALWHLHRILRPGGALIVEVPAGSKLYDLYDRVLMHQRRYDMRDLVLLAKNAGFAVERQSHLGFFLYPGFYLTKRLNQWRHRTAAPERERALVKQMITGTRSAGRLMRILMQVENVVRPHVYLSRGVRCLLTCRKPVDTT